MTFIAAMVASVAALLLPWFSIDQWSGDPNSSEHWWLLGQRACSAFARDAVECRVEFVEVELDWLLLPIFLLTRVVVLAAAVALAVTARRASSAPSRLSLAGGAAFLVFAGFIAASPGDMQYKNLSLSLGAVLALGGAAVAALHGLTLRRDVVVALTGAVLTLWSALWLPWAMQTDAISPADPDNQSAYSYSLLAKRHHWHNFKVSREHYLEDAIDDDTLARVDDDILEYAAPVLAALLGVALAALLFLRARGDTSLDAWRVAVGAAFLVFGATILRVPYELAGLWPGPGAVMAVVVVAGVVVDAALQPRRARSPGTSPGAPLG